MTQVARMKPSRQAFLLHGFTLVELLVVIAVIAILMGFLIPAVSSVRESARLMQCRGHLRQLAQACTSYASASGVLPTPGSAGVPGTAQNGGRLGDPNATTPGTAGGWLHLILPFVEQQPLYDLGTGLVGASGPNSLHEALRRKVATAVAVYTCANRGSPLFSPPSDNANILFINGGNSGLQWRFNPNPQLAARSDYAGSWADPGTGNNGALGRNPWSDNGRLLRSITDGQSNVFLCGERYLSPDNYNPTADTNFECNNRGWSAGAEGDVYAAPRVIGSGPPLPLLQDTRGVSGCQNCLNYDPNTSIRGCWGWPSRFGSSHSAGVPMAMVDGSVHLVAFDISPGVFAAICNISDNSGVADQLQ